MSSVHEDAKALFRRAVERASLAPSVHNTQPWHFVVRSEVLELRGDSDRQLRALDPTGPSNGDQLWLCLVQCPSWFGGRPRGAGGPGAGCCGTGLAGPTHLA